MVLFEVQTRDGKGRCLIATTHIKAGSIVIKEYPFLVAEDAYDAIYQLYGGEDEGESYGDDGEGNEDEGKQKRDAFEGLAPYTLDKYVISYEDICEEMSTLPEYVRESLAQIPKNKLRLYLAKFYRNAFTYTSPPCALLSLGSLMNHSCDNNVDFEVHARGYYIFKANRDIQAGEELCDSYLQTYKSTKKRKDRLLHQYGFACTCAKCQST